MDENTQQNPGQDDENTDFTDAGDPFELFQAWMKDAAGNEPNNPNAMALATVDAHGMPNVRIVLLKELDKDGFVFFTNTESAKGQELKSNPNASLCFYWKSLGRQVIIRGSVRFVSDEEADAYFASRPHGSRIGAWASKQSRPLESRLELENAISHYEKEFSGGEIPRPGHWHGYRLMPLEIEFWHDRPFRLHDRVVFSRDSADDNWKKLRLYP